MIIMWKQILHGVPPRSLFPTHCSSLHSFLSFPLSPYLVLISLSAPAASEQPAPAKSHFLFHQCNYCLRPTAAARLEARACVPQEEEGEEKEEKGNGREEKVVYAGTRAKWEWAEIRRWKAGEEGERWRSRAGLASSSRYSVIPRSGVHALQINKFRKRIDYKKG